ncbi:MAG: tetratricopeptide repeat protein [Gammaproteobacteria bacterium]|nr:tetratricopeptide repeat protein [Gammaproteobacteria bacterium]
MAGLPLPVRAALIAACGLLAAAPLAAQNPAASTSATPTAAVSEPLQIFARFKSALEANDLVTAEARARELVALTEARSGKDSRELVDPLTNLGTVHFRRGDFVAAEASYQRAVGLIEGQLAGADRQLIRPLQGLGETWLATNRPDEAIAALRRAVDLSRNLDGLYNAEQLDSVDALIEAYVALGRNADAEREHQYAFRIAETTYGKRDLRLVEPLDRYARWFESVGRYATARGLHARALQLAEELSADKPVVGVPALRGLARTWLLEAIYGPEVEAQPGFEVNDAGDPFGAAAGQSRLNSEGLRALSYAVEMIARSKPVDSRLLGETLAQIGDWHLVSGSTGRAYASYAESWKALGAAGPGARALLESPRVLVYRAPQNSVARMRVSEADDYAVRKVEMRLKVGADGRVDDAEIASTDAPENSTRAALLAARKTRFAPRLGADGAPAETEGVVLREKLLIRIQPEKPAVPRDQSATKPAPPKEPPPALPTEPPPAPASSPG